MKLTPSNTSSPTPESKFLEFVRGKATVGMNSDQIAADYAERWEITYELAKQRMKEPEFQQAIDAGYQSGLGKILEKLYDWVKNQWGC